MKRDQKQQQPSFLF